MNKDLKVGEIVIDWDKTKEHKKSNNNVEKSPLSELENGDIVYIRDDLENEREYGSNIFMAKYMLVGAQKVRDINFELNNITLVDNRGDYIYFYTPEMIDWDKTRVLNHPRAPKEDIGITIKDIWEYANKLYDKGLIYEMRKELHNDVEYISWNNKRRDDGYVNSNEDLEIAMNKLKLLEKETFTILTEEDINRVTARESVGFDSESMSVAKLKNGNEILITREVGVGVASGIAVYMRNGLYKNYLDLEVLEGAVVTQDIIVDCVPKPNVVNGVEIPIPLTKDELKQCADDKVKVYYPRPLGFLYGWGWAEAFEYKEGNIFYADPKDAIKASKLLFELED